MSGQTLFGVLLFILLSVGRFTENLLAESGRVGPVDTGSSSLLNQAQSMATAGKWSEAEPLVRGLLKGQPDSAEGHALLAYILFKQQRPKESMAEYIETAKLRDLTASEMKTFALSCAQLRMYSDAEKWLGRAIEMNPADAKAWEARGHLRVEEQHYADAISDFEQTLRIAPGTVSAQTGIGLSLELLSRLEPAIAAYKIAISWQTPGPSEDPAPLHALGRVLLKQNKPREALPYLQRAVLRGPGIAQAHEELARAYASLHRPEAAQKELEMAITLAPKVARLHFTLGQLYRESGKLEKAKSELALYDALVGTHSTPDVDPR
jgi:protein O-GlcNAc transferase